MESYIELEEEEEWSRLPEDKERMSVYCGQYFHLDSRGHCPTRPPRASRGPWYTTNRDHTLAQPRKNQRLFKPYEQVNKT